MKLIQVEKTGGPEVLKLQDVSGLEPPGEGQALVHIVAAGVNFIDIQQRRGSYPRQLPFTPGMEGSGVVEAVGQGVTHIKPSDRVAFSGLPGAYAEACLVDAERLIPLPDDFTFEQGAAFPLQGMTAQYLIHEFRPVRPGDVVLVHAAAGGVGLLLTQWARHLGARVIGTTSSEEKAIVAQKAGANEMILYTKQDFAAETRRLTADHGADVIFDSVGKATFGGDMQAVAVRGQIVIFGSASGPADPVAPNSLMARAVSLSGGSMANFLRTRDEMLGRANDVIHAVEEGWLKLNIGRILPLAEAAEAHRLIEARETIGKVLLVPAAEN
jgi:NADPH:quinone reductase